MAGDAFLLLVPAQAPVKAHFGNALGLISAGAVLFSRVQRTLTS